MNEKMDPREEHLRIRGPRDGMELFLRFLPSVARRPDKAPVLYVHGATFPSALSIAHRFDGRSWRDALCDEGFDVWALDFHGFGESDRYPEMSEPADRNAPLCTAADAALQLECAVRFALDQQRIDHISLVAHSWGSMVAGLFAGSHPALVDRIVLFAPIARRSPGQHETPPACPAWRIVTTEDQWQRFIEDVPAGAEPVLSRVHFERWARAYLASDPEARARVPAGVKVPMGPFSDIVRAWHGQLAYDPAAVRAPVAILRGEWDRLLPDADARWLFDAFTGASAKRDVKISRGTHLMHLEAMRLALWKETAAFLSGDDVAPVPV